MLPMNYLNVLPRLYFQVIVFQILNIGYNLHWLIKQPYSTWAFQNTDRLSNFVQPKVLSFWPWKFLMPEQNLVENYRVAERILVPLRLTFLRLGLAFNTQYTFFPFLESQNNFFRSIIGRFETMVIFNIWRVNRNIKFQN